MAQEPWSSEVLNNVTVEREFESGTRSETYAIGVIGGVVPGLREGGSQRGPRGHHAVKWDGEVTAAAAETRSVVYTVVVRRCVRR